MTENHPKFLPNHIILTYSHPASKVNSILNSKQFVKIRQKSYSKVTRVRDLIDFADGFWRQFVLMTTLRYWWSVWDVGDEFFISKNHLHMIRYFKTVTIIKSPTLGCQQQLDMVSSMLVADVGDQMCWWQVWDVGEMLVQMILPPTS